MFHVLFVIMVITCTLLFAYSGEMAVKEKVIAKRIKNNNILNKEYLAKVYADHVYWQKSM